MVLPTLSYSNAHEAPGFGVSRVVVVVVVVDAQKGRDKKNLGRGRFRGEGGIRVSEITKTTPNTAKAARTYRKKNAGFW